MNVNYLSQEKYDEIQREIDFRKGEKRRSIAEKIGTAKEQGDLSENFEYQSAKEAQAENETEIIRLQEILKNAVVVEAKSGEHIISLGVSFVAQLENGNEITYEIVGGQEADPMKGKISNESPIGSAFLGRGVNDTVEIETPSGTVRYKIISIK